MKELFFGETNGATGEALEPRAQGQVFAFQALHRGFANLMLFSGQTGPIGTPGIGEPRGNRPASARQQGHQTAKRDVGAATKNEGYYLPIGRIFYPPQPALPLFAAHKRPHLVGAQS